MMTITTSNSSNVKPALVGRRARVRCGAQAEVAEQGLHRCTVSPLELGAG
jgi:hypothetical protein